MKQGEKKNTINKTTYNNRKEVFLIDAYILGKKGTHIIISVVLQVKRTSDFSYWLLHTANS